MDQPFSRIADALLDRQFWSPDDPQKQPYDDTGWSFGDLFNAKVSRVTDRSILSAPMSRVADIKSTFGDRARRWTAFSGESLGVRSHSLRWFMHCMARRRYRFLKKDLRVAARSSRRARLIVSGVDAGKLKPLLQQFDLTGASIASQPSVKLHPAAAPRIAFMHTWLYTQTEGWWRMAFDKLHVPFTYINTQTAAKDADLRAKYDVIIFAPVAGQTAQRIVDGLPMWGNALPWQTTELTPNLGKLDSTEDMRPGLGEDGVAHLKKFVQEGGLLITSEDTAEFAIDEGLAPGVFVAPRKTLKVVGSVLNSAVVDSKNPLAYGYDGAVPLYSANGLAFTVSNLIVNRNILTLKEYKRPTGRGGPEDEDTPEGRPTEKAPPLPAPKAWQATPLNEDQERNNPFVIPAEYRPKVILRYAAMKDLLLSGLLENGDPVAEHAAVVDARFGKGDVLLFANNPVYRGETIGSYALVFNAIVNFGHLR